MYQLLFTSQRIGFNVHGCNIVDGVGIAVMALCIFYDLGQSEFMFNVECEFVSLMICVKLNSCLMLSVNCAISVMAFLLDILL